MVNDSLNSTDNWRLISRVLTGRLLLPTEGGGPAPGRRVLRGDRLALLRGVGRRRAPLRRLALRHLSYDLGRGLRLVCRDC